MGAQTQLWLSLWQPHCQAGPRAAGRCTGAATACLVCLQVGCSLCGRRGPLLPATAQKVCASARPQPGSAGCACGCRRRPAGRQHNLLTLQLHHDMGQLGQLAVRACGYSRSPAGRQCKLLATAPPLHLQATADRGSAAATELLQPATRRRVKAPQIASTTIRGLSAPAAAWASLPLPRPLHCPPPPHCWTHSSAAWSACKAASPHCIVHAGSLAATSNTSSSAATCPQAVA